MKNIFFPFILLISSFGFGQAPVIEWQKSLGGSDWDEAETIHKTTDNGYIIAGYSRSNDGDITGNHGGIDYWVVKLDSAATIEWQKSLGGSGDDFAQDIQQTTDGGYIVAGISDSNDGDVTNNNGGTDYWVVKLDALGSITWEESYGGSSDDVLSSIKQTIDGGYVIAGLSGSNDGDVSGNNGVGDYWIIKIDATGNISWQHSIGGSELDRAFFIEQTTDQGYIVTGRSRSNNGDVSGNHGGDDYWVVKLTSLGTVSWEKSFGGSGWEYAYSVRETIDGGYIVAGFSNSNDGDITNPKGSRDYWFIRLDQFGNLVWEKSLGGSGWDEAYSLQQTADGSYIVTGHSNSNDGDLTVNQGSSDYWVIKIDTLGNKLWQKSLGGSSTDIAWSIEEVSPGVYILAGFSESTDGDVSGNHGNRDFWIVKLSPDTAHLQNNTMLNLNLYPNPTTNTFTITTDKVINASFKIVDAQGKEVLSGKMNGKEQNIDISSLSKGTYSIVFEDEELPVLSVIKE